MSNTKYYQSIIKKQTQKTCIFTPYYLYVLLFATWEIECGMKYTPGSQIKCYKTKQIKEKPSSMLSKLKLISWKKRSRSGWESTSTESQCDNSFEKSSLWCSSSRPKRQLGKNWNAGVEEVGHEFQLFPLLMPQLLSRKCICLREKKWYFSAVCSFRIEQEERDSGRDGGNEELSVPGPPPPTQQAGRHSKRKVPFSITLC